MNYYVGTVIFLMGLFIGSFLNVCIYRIPEGKSIAVPPSSCMKCGARIKWYDLIPVVSYLALKGRCRNCGEKISPRYMLVELLTGVLFLVCFMVFGLTGQFFAFAVLTGILITITFTDIDSQIIPDSVMIFALIAGIVFVLLGFVPESATLKENALAALLGLVCGAGPLIIINLLSLAIIKKAGIGGGDIKLMGVAGIFLGMTKTISALVIGIVIGGVFSIFALRKKRMQEEKNDRETEQGEDEKFHETPFGPYLAAGIFISMLFGQRIVEWYLGLY